MINRKCLRSQSCLQAATGLNVDRLQRSHPLLRRNAFIMLDAASFSLSDFSHFVCVSDRLARHFEALGYVIEFLVVGILGPFKLAETLRAEKIFNPILLLLLSNSI